MHQEGIDWWIVRARSTELITPDVSHHFCLYGISIELSCHIPDLDDQLSALLGDFRTTDPAPVRQTMTGTIREYNEADVVRHLSPGARRMPSPDAYTELYEDAERFWLIDDRWGMVEINLLKSSWRVWLLSSSRIDPMVRAEMALLWPLAQLSRARGLHLVPAASMVRNGSGMLLISTINLSDELSVMLRAGYRVIGQRWTGLREENGKIMMLRVPGMVEKSSASPRRMSENKVEDGLWVDLNDGRFGTQEESAICDNVLVISPGRRPIAQLRELSTDALNVLRSAWPIPELHPHRRRHRLPATLAKHCACFEAAVSRESDDFLQLLSALPARGTGLYYNPRESAVPTARRAVA